MGKEDFKQIVIAYKSAEGTFGGTEVLSGTAEQVEQLKKSVIESWKGMDTEGVNIVYEGKSLKKAKAAIKGLESVDEETISLG